MADVEDEPVAAHSSAQRWPKAGEPVCVCCGRYGAYVCDATEEDVCSLECKARAVARRQPSRLDSAATAAIRTKLGIDVQGQDVAAPMLDFAALGLPPHVGSSLLQAGYEIPTPVQLQFIPCALAGRDMLVQAAPGTGKTLGFVLPLVLGALGLQPRRALVLAPTRELCLQTDTLVQTLLHGSPTPCARAVVVGGQSVRPQVHRLKDGAMIICATPGRLLDILARNDGIHLGDISTLVLDEADRMLALGFARKVDDVIGRLPATRQTLLVSATIPPAVEAVACRVLRDPIRLAVKKAHQLEAGRQTVLWVADSAKRARLLALLQTPGACRLPMVVFVASRQGADLLAATITKMAGLDARPIHGGMAQPDRTAALAAFLNGEFPVVVATGLLGRGLAIVAVRQVVVFDVPATVDEYEHMLGRASHLGEPGWAVTFVCQDDRSLLPALAARLHEWSTRMPPEVSAHLRTSAPAKRAHGGGIGDMLASHTAKKPCM